MNERDTVRLSKFLARILRHDPAALGLTPDPAGWIDVETLRAAAARQGRRFSRADLDHVVTTSAKQRFAFSDDGTRIRANQGHSITVDLGLPPIAPPAVLYHGTADRTVPAIFRDGLLPMTRHAVHLSADAETARRVGGRHGRPVVLIVDAAAMAADGHEFRRSANGVWLAAAVPPRYLRRA